MDTTLIAKMHQPKDLDYLNIDRILNANVRYITGADIALLQDADLFRRFQLVFLNRGCSELWVQSGQHPHDQKVLAFELQLKNNSFSPSFRDLLRVARSYQCGFVRIFTEVGEDAYRVTGLHFQTRLPGDEW